MMMSRTVLFNTLIVALLLSTPKAAFCDDLSELKAQIQGLQEETKALQEQLNKQREVTKHLSEKAKASESTEQDLSNETRSFDVKPTKSVLDHNHDTELQGSADIPKLIIKGFADLGFTAKITHNNEDGNSFTLGALDLFTTSEIAGSVSFLAEPVFYFDTETNEQEFELQRAELKYSLSDLFNIKVGRIHTPLGYWNHAFHHGAWLQTSVFRPEIYLFEDDGGVLPVHSVGIEFFGGKQFRSFDLEYNFDVLNGRGRTRTEIQHVRDANDSKAINVLLSLIPHLVEGLKLGVDLYLDTIPSNPSDPARTNEISERIVGGYGTYLNERVELLGELFHIYHDDKTSGNDFDTLGFYVQGGYRINTFKPYYRFDLLDFEKGDPYFTPDDLGIRKHTLGLRWDIFTWNALKLEYSFSDKKNKDDEHLLTVNSSFAF